MAIYQPRRGRRGRDKQCQSGVLLATALVVVEGTVGAITIDNQVLTL